MRNKNKPKKSILDVKLNRERLLLLVKEKEMISLYEYINSKSMEYQKLAPPQTLKSFIVECLEDDSANQNVEIIENMEEVKFYVYI